MGLLRNRVAVAGVGYSDILRRTDRTLADLTLQAVDSALTDAGLSRADIDGIATSPAMPRYGGAKGAVEGIDVVTPHHLARLLGISESVSWVGATEMMVTQSVMDAAMAIASGVCTHAVVYRAVHVPDGKYVDFGSAYATGKDQFLAPYGFSSPPAWIATVMRRYMHLYGYEREDFLDFLVANRERTNLNPNAYWSRKTLSLEECRTARMISDPVSVFDCDLPVDGAVALVLTSTERARDLRQKPAVLAGFATSMYDGAGGAPMNWEDLTAGVRHTGERLWRATGLTASNIDVAQLYDGFSFLVYAWMEGLGFAEEGRGVAAAQRDQQGRTNVLPLNTGGGSLGEGRLHGMTQIVEAVAQVTGRAGPRTVVGAQHSLATISNGLTKSAAFVFSTDN